jgi:hypothetical protein
MSTYLYGVIRQPTSRSRLTADVLGTGVGEPPAKVRILPYQQIAAVVSTASGQIGEEGGIRAMRRDMAAHAAVQSRVMAVRTILPARFGMLVPDDREVIATLLEPQLDQLLEDLQRLRGMSELKLSADYVESDVIARVVKSDPQLARLARQSALASHTQRIDFGRQIAAAIQQRREQDTQWLLESLRPLVRQIVVDDAPSDLSVLRASLLAPTAQIDEVAAALARLADEAAGILRLSCVGPLPPYSFVQVGISEKEHAWDY